jgi:hypothetical protein
MSPGKVVVVVDGAVVVVVDEVVVVASVVVVVSAATEQAASVKPSATSLAVLVRIEATIREDPGYPASPDATIEDPSGHLQMG